MIGWRLDVNSLRWSEADKCFIGMLREFEVGGPRAVAYAAGSLGGPQKEEFTGEVAFVRLDVAVVTGKKVPTLKPIVEPLYYAPGKPRVSDIGEKMKGGKKAKT